MKKKSIYVLLVLIIIPFGGCYQTDDGGHIAPITIYEKIKGNWKLDKLTLVDEFAKANAITPDNEELSSWFNFNSFTIQLKVDEYDMPTGYTVSGDVPELFLKEGYWELSSPYPNTNLTAVVINLYADAAKTKLVDKLRLTSIPGSQETLEIQLVRETNQVAYATYVFNLSAVN